MANEYLVNRLFRSRDSRSVVEVGIRANFALILVGMEVLTRTPLQFRNGVSFC